MKSTNDLFAGVKPTAWFADCELPDGSPAGRSYFDNGGELGLRHPLYNKEDVLKILSAPPTCDWCKTLMHPAKNSQGGIYHYCRTSHNHGVYVGEAEIKRDDDDIPGPPMPALAPWELSKAEAQRKVADYLKTIHELQDELTEARELIDKLKAHILEQSQAIATRRSNNLRLDRINREQQELIENIKRLSGAAESDCQVVRDMASKIVDVQEQRDKARAALINIREGIINEEKNGLWEADIIISIIDRALSPDKYCCPICQQEDCNPKYY